MFTIKNKLILVYIGLAAVFFVLYLFLFGPLLRQLKSEAKQLREVEASLIHTRNTVNLMRELSARLQLASEKELPAAEDELTSLDKAYKIEIVSKKTGEASLKDKYARFPIQLTIKSGYSELANYLGALDDLQKSVVKLNKLDVSVSKEDPAKLKAKVTLYMYLLR